MPALTVILAVAVVAILGIVVLRMLFPLPKENFAAATAALPPDYDSPLGQAVAPVLESHPGLSGVRPLVEGRNAYAARAILALEAVTSIDAQYYIWQDDTTGIMLLDELRAAAARGVKVRLLLDDNGISGLDALVAELHAMPTAEVRIFNPFTLRRPKLLCYLFDFRRLNRRMHNKSMTVDGVVSILGGRNVGDIYFAYGDGTHFLDVDALLIGPVVAEVTAAFDRYWNSASAYAADRILEPAIGSSIAELAAERRSRETGASYQAAVAENALGLAIRARELTFEWDRCRLFVDDPAKGLGKLDQDQHMVEQLFALTEEARSSVDLVSAYFVPGPRGAELLETLARRGVRVRVLTNSLEATDVLPVHGAYMKYRKGLLRAGVELQELRSLRAERLDMSWPEKLGGSASSLHTKVFGFDGTRVFIGSHNLDPRSAQLNCEMGLVIESPELAGILSSRMGYLGNRYLLSLDDAGEIVWTKTVGEGDCQTYDADPETSGFKRMMARAVGVLPFEWML